MMLNEAGLMKILSISGHYRGFRFLLECVNLGATDENLLSPIYRRLYPLVAKRYGTTVKHVNSSIRNFIKAWWLYGKRDTLFPRTKPRTAPGNKAFIYALIVYVLRATEKEQ